MPDLNFFSQGYCDILTHLKSVHIGEDASPNSRALAANSSLVEKVITGSSEDGSITMTKIPLQNNVPPTMQVIETPLVTAASLRRHLLKTPADVVTYCLDPNQAFLDHVLRQNMLRVRDETAAGALHRKAARQVGIPKPLFDAYEKNFYFGKADATARSLHGGSYNKIAPSARNSFRGGVKRGAKAVLFLNIVTRARRKERLEREKHHAKEDRPDRLMYNAHALEQIQAEEDLVERERVSLSPRERQRQAMELGHPADYASRGTGRGKADLHETFETLEGGPRVSIAGTGRAESAQTSSVTAQAASGRASGAVASGPVASGAVGTATEMSLGRQSFSRSSEGSHAMEGGGSKASSGVGAREEGSALGDLGTTTPSRGEFSTPVSRRKRIVLKRKDRHTPNLDSGAETTNILSPPPGSPPPGSSLVAAGASGVQEQSSSFQNSQFLEELHERNKLVISSSGSSAARGDTVVDDIKADDNTAGRSATPADVAPSSAKNAKKYSDQNPPAVHVNLADLLSNNSSRSSSRANLLSRPSNLRPGGEKTDRSSSAPNQNRPSAGRAVPPPKPEHSHAAQRRITTWRHLPSHMPPSHMRKRIMEEMELLSDAELHTQLLLLATDMGNHNLNRRQVESIVTASREKTLRQIEKLVLNDLAGTDPRPAKMASAMTRDGEFLYPKSLMEEKARRNYKRL